eukprot:349839-Chlamydomonas_euryale.AAC.1
MASCGCGASASGFPSCEQGGWSHGDKVGTFNAGKVSLLSRTAPQAVGCDGMRMRCALHAK